VRLSRCDLSAGAARRPDVASHALLNAALIAANAVDAESGRAARAGIARCPEASAAARARAATAAATPARATGAAAPPARATAAATVRARGGAATTPARGATAATIRARSAAATTPARATTPAATATRTGDVATPRTRDTAVARTRDTAAACARACGAAAATATTGPGSSVNRGAGVTAPIRVAHEPTWAAVVAGARDGSVLDARRVTARERDHSDHRQHTRSPPRAHHPAQNLTRTLAPATDGPATGSMATRAWLLV
jgi:hypothetical protein